MSMLHKDWELAKQHGKHSQTFEREDLVTFRKSDLESFLNEIKADVRSDFLEGMSGGSDERL